MYSITIVFSTFDDFKELVKLSNYHQNDKDIIVKVRDFDFYGEYSLEGLVFNQRRRVDYIESQFNQKFIK